MEDRKRKEILEKGGVGGLVDLKETWTMCCHRGQGESIIKEEGRFFVVVVVVCSVFSVHETESLTRPNAAKN